jgi:hypothetical protein
MEEHEHQAASARLDAMIEQAEAELAAHKVRLERDGRSPDLSDPFNQLGHLELWLTALRSCRDRLRQSDT